MDGWLDGWMDGKMDGLMARWKDGWKEGWKDGRVHGRMVARNALLPVGLLALLLLHLRVRAGLGCHHQVRLHTLLEHLGARLHHVPVRACALSRCSSTTLLQQVVFLSSHPVLIQRVVRETGG